MAVSERGMIVMDRRFVALGGKAADCALNYLQLAYVRLIMDTRAKRREGALPDQVELNPKRQRTGSQTTTGTG